MEFINQDLAKEFQRLCKEYPDIEGFSHPYMNMSDALRAYFALADYFTDSSADRSERMLVGLRSADLLYSALSRQRVTFGNHTKYTERIDICSTLFYGMVKNHAFSDGNKRTALLLLLYQLDTYGLLPSVSAKSFEKLVVAVAANELQTEFQTAWKKHRKYDDAEIKTIAFLLRSMTKKKDHSYHIKLTINDMNNALKTYGVNSTISAGKIHFERIEQGGFLRKERTYKYSFVFGGWTRCIGAQTARDLLQNLGLYNQIPDYASLLSGQEPYYSLIQDFEVPLRRLKDE